SSLLFVEDSPINLKILVASAKRLGYRFETAMDGLQVVDAYRKESFDAVMDIQMPKMDGMEACRAIHQYEWDVRRKSTFIIILTALTSQDAEQMVLDSGANRFFSTRNHLLMRSFRKEFCSSLVRPCTTEY
ncbi:CheY-like superfamily, partial [Amylocarpus encephaloides]